MAELVIMEKTELGKCLLHLVDGASAVEELERGMGLRKDVACDQ